MKEKSKISDLILDQMVKNEDFGKKLLQELHQEVLEKARAYRLETLEDKSLDELIDYMKRKDISPFQVRLAISHFNILTTEMIDSINDKRRDVIEIIKTKAPLFREEDFN